MLYPTNRPLIGLAVATVIVLATGVLDDRFDLSWRWRLIAQATAGLVLYFIGGVKVEMIGTALGLPGHTLGVLSLPFTVLATIGIMNAINMADGVDGLAGSLAAAAMAMLAAAAVYAGNVGMAAGLLVLLGATAGFLTYNLRTPWQGRARVFLGGGSEFLGLVLAWASFRLTQNVAHPVTPVLAPFLIAPPVIDCLVLMVRRGLAGRSPFRADRNHMHHLLMDAGLNPSGAVLVIVALSAVMGLLAALALLAKIPQPAFVAAFLALTIGYFVFTADRGRAVAALGRLVRLSRLGEGGGPAAPLIHSGG
jgi:UDP-GlcNAc:undecaprenyl-phosphate GlcNAc-1-phosphate transferase